MNSAATWFMLLGLLLGVGLLVFALLMRRGNTPPPTIMGRGFRHKHPIPPSIPRRQEGAPDPTVIESDAVDTLAEELSMDLTPDESPRVSVDVPVEEVPYDTRYEVSTNELDESFDDADEVEVLPPWDVPSVASIADRPEEQKAAIESGFESSPQENQELDSLQLAFDELLQRTEHYAAERAQLIAALEQRETESADRESKYRATLDEFQQLLGQHEATLASRDREKLDLMNQLQDWQQKSHQTAAGEEWREELRQTAAARDGALAERSLLQETVRQLNQHVTQRDIRVTQLERERLQFRDTQAALQQRLEAAEAAMLTEEDRQLAQKEKEELIASFERRLHEAQGGASAARADLEDARQSLKAIQDDLTQRDVQWRDHVGHLQQQHDATKQQLVQVKQQLADVQQIESVSEQSLASMQTELHDEAASLRQQLKEALERASTISEQERSIESSAVQLATVTRELQVASQQLNASKQQLEERDRRWQARTGELESELFAARSEISSLSRQIALLETTSEASAATPQEKERYERALQELKNSLNAHVTKANDQLLAWTQERQQFVHQQSQDELQTQRMRQELGQLQQNLGFAEARYTDARTSLEQTTRLLEESRLLLATMESTSSSVMTDWESQLAQSAHQVELLQTEMGQQQDLVGAAQEELDFRGREIYRLQQELIHQRQQTEVVVELPDPELVQEVELLSGNLSATRAQLQRHQHDLIEMKQELAWLHVAQETWVEEKQSLLDQLEIARIAVIPRETDVLPDDTAADPKLQANHLLQIQGDLQERTNSVASLQRQVESIQQALLNELDHGRQWQVRAAEAERALMSLEPAVAQQQAEVSRLMVERDRVAEAAAIGSRTIATLTAQNMQYQSEIRELQTQSTFHSRELQILQEQLANRESAWGSRLELQISEAVAGTRQELQTRQQQLELTWNSELQIAKQQVEAAETKRQELAALCEVAEQRRCERESQLESTRRRLQDAAQANEELSLQIKSVQSRLKEATPQADVELLHQSLAELKSQLHVDEQAAKRREEALAVTNRKLHESQQQVEDRQRAIEELESALASIPSTLKEAGQDRKEAKQLRVASERQIKKLAVQEQRLQDIALELSRARGEVATLHSELNQQQAVVRALTRGNKSVSVTSHNGNPDATLSGAGDQNKRRRKSAPASSVSGDLQSGSGKPSPPAVSAAASLDQPVVDLGIVYTSPPEKSDDLKAISGIGPALEKRLNSIGIYQFAQIKGWTKPAVDHVDQRLALGGRIQRERWVQQARKLDNLTLD